MALTNSKYAELTQDFLEGMKSAQNDLSRIGIMLAGDPGVGKTSFVKAFVKLLGINEIIIEVPHIVEEHVINVPFVIVNSMTGQVTSDTTRVDLKGATAKDVIDKKEDERFSIELADSNLITQIKNQPVVAQENYLEYVYKLSEDLVDIFEDLGGTRDSVPELISRARKNVRTILFIDEYWRKTSMNIRNILRSILNGKIGLSKIPEGTFVVYASNLEDSGLETWTKNNDFYTLELEASDFPSWKKWLVGKYGVKTLVLPEPEEGVEGKKKARTSKKAPPMKVQTNDDSGVCLEIVDLLEPILTDPAKMNYKEGQGKTLLRVSPRRWAQIVLYISSSLPLANKGDADALIESLWVNFRNYQTEKMADIAGEVIGLVKSFINKNFGITTDNRETPNLLAWQRNLSHQIVQKMRLGENRTYLPVISGPPGMAKTMMIRMMADEFGLQLVEINCPELNKEDASGIPLPGKAERTIGFSKPPLLEKIDLAISEAGEPDPGQIAKWKSVNKHGYKYLIFFDELNRVGSEEVFNSLRRVILEKNFNEKFALPEGSILVAAINPDDLGTKALTSHFKDVADIIPGGPSFDDLISHINNRVLANAELKNTNVGPVVVKILNEFIERYKDVADGKNDPRFHLNFGSAMTVSGREYTDIISRAAIGLDEALLMAARKNVPIEDAKQHFKERIAKAFIGILTSSAYKHKADKTAIIGLVTNYFLENDKINSLLDELTVLKNTNTVPLKKILVKYLDDPSLDLLHDIKFSNYLGTISKERLVADWTEFLKEQFTTAERLIELIGKSDSPEKVRDAEGNVIEITKTLIPKLAHLYREVVVCMKAWGKVEGGPEYLGEKVIEVLAATYRDACRPLKASDPDKYFEIQDFIQNITAYVNSYLDSFRKK